MCVAVRGDDVTALGTDADVFIYEVDWQKTFELKHRGRIGEGCSGPNAIRVLNRCIKLTETGVIYEGDPRHVDLLSSGFGLSKATAVTTLGVKETYANGEAVKSDDLPATTSVGDNDGDAHSVCGLTSGRSTSTKDCY